MASKMICLALSLTLLGAVSFLTGCVSDVPEIALELQYEGRGAVDEIDAFIAENPVDTSVANWKTRVPHPPFVNFKDDRPYFWLLNTSEGLLKIRLRPDWAPRHVSSTIYLTRLGFYDGLSFHRVIRGFMAQGGDPIGTGGGSPGFRYSGEFHKNAKHDKRGVVSMANAGPRSDGSQFFILFKEAPSLDYKHTVFGVLAEGRGTLGKMERKATKSGTLRRPILIRNAEILLE